MRTLLPTILPPEHRAALLATCRGHTREQREVLRARIVLGHAGGVSVRKLAHELGCSPSTALKWIRRYARAGLGGLTDAPRTGAPVVHPELVRALLAELATAAPPSPYGVWTHQRLATALGDAGHLVSASWVGRALHSMSIRVHRIQGWLHRKPDPEFAPRLAAIETAVAAGASGEQVVLCIDEKTAVAVRTPCHLDTFFRGARRREFEYVRRGTITWYGIQEVGGGKITLRLATGSCNSLQFIQVLEELVEIYGSTLTLIMDNGPAHTSKLTRAWLAAHPNITICYTPVHASWANPVEVVFSVLTRQVLRGGFFTSTDQLEGYAQAWVKLRNLRPRPVRWSWSKDVLRTSDAGN